VTLDYSAESLLKVDSAKQVEIIIQSVVQQYGLMDVRLQEIRQESLGWMITIGRGEAD
jgi:hypothetical protein